MARLFRCACGTALLVGILTLPACSKPTMMKIFYPHADNATLGQTGEEHYNRVSRDWEHDRRLLQEDLDLLFMTDRPSRLTKWHVK